MGLSSLPDPFFKFIEQTSGILLNDRNLAMIQKLMEQDFSGVHRSDLQQQLTDAPFTHPIWQKFIQALTVGETYFFRNRSHVKALSEHVLPEIIQTRRAQNLKQIRIWSAGCATGEESYTLAILLHQLLPDIHDWSISLTATDINLAYLAYAEKGVYTRRSFRNETPPELAEKWFIKNSSQFEIKPQLRQFVTFKPLNLITDVYPSYAYQLANVDMIVCRNVTIYFDQQTTGTVIRRFFNTLTDGGWLLVGHSEPNLEGYRMFSARNLAGAIVYQKQTQPEQQPAMSPVRPPRPPRADVPLEKPRQASRRTGDHKSDAHQLLEQAQDAANQQNWQQALDLLNLVELSDKFNPKVHYLRGIIYRERGDYPAALLAMRQAIYCDPNFALAHYMLGDIFKQQGQLSGARRHWQIARSFLKSQPPDKILDASNGLTVDMLIDLIDFNLSS